MAGAGLRSRRVAGSSRDTAAGCNRLHCAYPRASQIAGGMPDSGPVPHHLNDNVHQEQIHPQHCLFGTAPQQQENTQKAAVLDSILSPKHKQQRKMIKDQTKLPPPSAHTTHGTAYFLCFVYTKHRSTLVLGLLQTQPAAEEWRAALHWRQHPGTWVWRLSILVKGVLHKHALVYTPTMDAKLTKIYYSPKGYCNTFIMRYTVRSRM